MRLSSFVRTSGAIVLRPGRSERGARGSTTVALIESTSLPISSLRPLRPGRLIILVSVIRSRASRRLTFTAAAVRLANCHSGARSNVTAGAALAGGGVPAGAGGGGPPPTEPPLPGRAGREGP